MDPRAVTDALFRRFSQPCLDGQTREYIAACAFVYATNGPQGFVPAATRKFLRDVLDEIAAELGAKAKTIGDNVSDAHEAFATIFHAVLDGTYTLRLANVQDLRVALALFGVAPPKKGRKELEAALRTAIAAYPAPPTEDVAEVAEAEEVAEVEEVAKAAEEVTEAAEVEKATESGGWHLVQEGSPSAPSAPSAATQNPTISSQTESLQLFGDQPERIEGPSEDPFAIAKGPASTLGDGSGPDPVSPSFADESAEESALTPPPKAATLKRKRKELLQDDEEPAQAPLEPARPHACTKHTKCMCAKCVATRESRKKRKVGSYTNTFVQKVVVYKCKRGHGSKRANQRKRAAQAAARAARAPPRPAVLNHEAIASAAADAKRTADAAAAAARVNKGQFMLIGTMKTDAPLGRDIEVLVGPGDAIKKYPVSCNAHIEKKLLLAMKDPCTLAVFDVKTVDSAGVPSVVRVAYGPMRLWSNTLRRVHLSMHQAIACAGHFTHVRPDGHHGRWPTERRRGHAVLVLGEEYHVRCTGSAKESVGSYDGMSHQDSASSSSGSA